MYDREMIGKENFREMIEQGKVIRTPSSHGGVIYEVLKLLEKNAMTLEAIADKLNIERRTVYNAVNHLRQRHNKKILRFYNPNGRKFYYYLSE